MKPWQELSFEELVRYQVPAPFEGTLLCLDPGETTGYGIFHNLKLVEAGQAATKPIETGANWLQNILKTAKPEIVIFESYRVYAWKTDQHTYNDLHTSQFIGTIKTLCGFEGIPYHEQTAQIAKAFCTDDKLELWKMYKKGQKHCRDAVRHGCYYLFHPPRTAV